MLFVFFFFDVGGILKKIFFFQSHVVKSVKVLDTTKNKTSYTNFLCMFSELSKLNESDNASKFVVKILQGLHYFHNVVADEIMSNLVFLGKTYICGKWKMVA